MKPLYILVAYIVTQASGNPTNSPVIVPNTESHEQLVADEVKRMSTLSVDHYDVGYITVQGNIVAPAYIPWGKKIIYQWQGIKVDVRLLPTPKEGQPFSRGDVRPFNPQVETGWTIVSFKPPIKYYENVTGSYIKGYFDHTHAVFFQIDSNEYGRNDISVKDVIKLDTFRIRNDFSVRVINITED